MNLYRLVWSHADSQFFYSHSWLFYASSLTAAQRIAAKAAGVVVSQWLPCALDSAFDTVSFPTGGGALVVSLVKKNARNRKKTADYA